MKQVVNINWIENMMFEAEVNGHKMILDANTDGGGQDKGPRPKPLMLAALGGCTGMDVVSILKKMKVDIQEFNVIVEGDITDEHPKKYTNMHVIYQFKGENLSIDKLQKAVNLSEEKYCGVSSSIKDCIKITTEIRII